jgi:hypothetical protein
MGLPDEKYVIRKGLLVISPANRKPCDVRFASLAQAKEACSSPRERDWCAGITIDGGKYCGREQRKYSLRTGVQFNEDDTAYRSWLRITNGSSLVDAWRASAQAQIASELDAAKAAGHSILHGSRALDREAMRGSRGHHRAYARLGSTNATGARETIVSLPSLEKRCLHPETSCRANGSDAHQRIPHICMGVLVFEGPLTLRNALTTWNASGLYNAVHERAAFLQGPPHPIWTSWARAAVEGHGFHVLLAARQLYHLAFVRLAQWCTAPAVLLVEEDFAIRETRIRIESHSDTHTYSHSHTFSCT